MTLEICNHNCNFADSTLASKDIMDVDFHRHIYMLRYRRPFLEDISEAKLLFHSPLEPGTPTRKNSCLDLRQCHPDKALTPLGICMCNWRYRTLGRQDKLVLQSGREILHELCNREWYTNLCRWHNFLKDISTKINVTNLVSSKWIFDWNWQEINGASIYQPKKLRLKLTRKLPSSQTKIAYRYLSIVFDFVSSNTDRRHGKYFAF